jgi:hypothetical protein
LFNNEIVVKGITRCGIYREGFQESATLEISCFEDNFNDSATKLSVQRLRVGKNFGTSVNRTMPATVRISDTGRSRLRNPRHRPSGSQRLPQGDQRP